MSRIDEQVKYVMENKIRPTAKSVRFMKVLGKEKTLTALKHGLLTIKCNDDKTFDVIITNSMVKDLEATLNSKLKELGYCLTEKGKKYLVDQYKLDNLNQIILDVGEDRLERLRKEKGKFLGLDKDDDKGNYDG